MNTKQAFLKFFHLTAVTAITGIFSISVIAQKPQDVIHVESYGKGDPVILIPGLMSDGSVWQQTIEQLQDDHQVLVVNVAGFGKTPKVAGTNLHKVEQAIVDYVNQHHIKQPVVIGHSMGGFLSLALAVNPNIEVKKAISVDGLPYIGAIFARTNQVTVDMMQPQAKGALAYFQNMDQQQLVAQTRQGLAIQATSQQAQQKILDFAAESDPVTVGQITYDLLMRDIRQELVGDKTPILMLGASGGFDTDEQHAAVESLYRGQLANSPNAQVQMNTHSRHFIMFDDAKWLATQIAQFIGE
ncbi:alpha/beta fold hydrolase [Neptunicella marina]|uniref:Alpha/beta hydrolase n=1 Tax=Neptunicella marina TaxID=2125989 RepID=A0A8J6LYK2_9ALTE|nr:alpha/beta hydrolase [Neptunicella marina]MBC3766209.1 alpha/beta hydrolase [Neptunicella marina]